MNRLKCYLNSLQKSFIHETLFTFVQSRVILMLKEKIKELATKYADEFIKCPSSSACPSRIKL